MGMKDSAWQLEETIRRSSEQRLIMESQRDGEYN